MKKKRTRRDRPRRERIFKDCDSIVLAGRLLGKKERVVEGATGRSINQKVTIPRSVNVGNTLFQDNATRGSQIIN
jgi:hypothetical protein